MHRAFVERQTGIDALTKFLEGLHAITSKRDGPDGSTILSCCAGKAQLTLSYLQPQHWKERKETEELYSVAALADFWRIFKRSADRDFMDRIAAILQPHQWTAQQDHSS